MLTEIEKTGKTIDDALQQALLELGVTQERVTYEILEMPSRGFLGLIGTRPARLRVTMKKLSPIEKAMEFLQKLFAAMRMEISMERREIEGGYVFELTGEALGVLIGKHGQTLDALQYLTNLAANRDLSQEKVRILLDIENYRKRREETLYRLAKRLADKVKRDGDQIVLEPMNRHERKIIHMALQEDRRIITYSNGDEPYRKVVIALKR